MGFKIDVFEDPLSDEGKVFSINNYALQYHDLEMYIHEIAGFMYGTMIQYYGQADMHESYSAFSLYDTSGDAIHINIKSTAETRTEDQRVANEISTAIWKYVGNKLVNDMMHAIHAGAEVRIGPVTAHRGGIRFENTGAADRHNLPWEIVGCKYSNGALMIYSITDHELFHWLDLRTVMHAHTLGGVVRMIMADPTLMLVLKGQRNPFPYFPPND